MKAEIVIEVIEKLIGYVQSVGSCHIDNERYENLKELKQVMYYFTDILIEESYGADSYMGSVARSGKYARKTLVNLKEKIDEALEE